MAASSVPEFRQGPGYFGRAYAASVRTGIAMMLQYRFAIAIWAVWGFVGPLVSLAVWHAAGSARGGAITNAATGATFTAADFTAYYLTLMIFGHITMSWDAFEFAFRVRSGALSPHLLRPIHPIHHDAANNISFKLATSMMMIPFWAFLFWWLKPTPPPSVWTVVVAIPALLLAAIIRYVWQYCLAAIAFWTTRVEAIQQLYFTTDAFLGGRIAPLALMPVWLAGAAHYSPFRAMGAFPVEVALGRVSPPELLVGYGLQFIWLGLGLIALRVVWAAGVKQYSAVGA